ncbi:neural cell adhesion molecule L1-like protein isoform X2 [Scleropages formosus]|uniref:neural cell adhesion molecule L1-like protein isoform X2 n=1 Tax=Scleropages formosus TaxID=113540 RepID=UPI0010FA73F8|nr:neural cell adhesion molecule L1-like protein isoform X2 [Scleropages formosus]
MSAFCFSLDLITPTKGRPMGSSWRLSLMILSAVCFHVRSLDIPLEVEQLPTITQQAPRLLIAFPFDESYTFECKARGNPEPEYHWTKNGFRFDPRQDPRLIMEDDAGSFTIPSGKNITQYGGRYRCYASNRLGTAVSEETQFIVSNSPKFPKEKIDPIVVEDGQSVVLECNPPSGIPPRTIYWMTIGLKQIEQNQRVSTGLDGNLYFSNTLEEDSREDYCCFASFPSIPTIVQKTPMAMLVRSRSDDNSTVQRKPSLMAPSGVQTQVRLVKGEDLQLECMAEGFPTPVVTWTKSGENLPNHSSIENFRKRLVIPKINKDNEGIYVCKAENSAGETTHEFHVTVEEPPHWLVKPESQLKSSGSDVHLQCSAAGNPQPEITWMMNGHLLKDAPEFGGQLLGDTVVLHNVKPADSAVYQCQASNRHGTLLVNVNVMVLDLGPLILTEDRKKYEAVVGTTVLLHCKVFSSPPSVTTWAKGDTVDSVAGENFYIQEDGSLKIHNVQKEDAGEYTCFSINSQGNATILASLDIKEATQIVEHPQNLHVVSGNTAQFTCRASYDESLTRSFEVHWEKDNVEISLNQTEFPRYFVEENVLHITNVSHSDQGTYQCVVRTSLDQDLASALLIVQGVPDAPEHLELYEPDNRRVKLKWVPGDDHNSTTTEFIVEYEESRWEPGRWRELQRVSGNQTWAQLDLNGHLDYQFRVSALSAIGRGPPSRPTERYKTPATAPDSSPSNIKSEGNLPHEMIIHWEPLLPVEHNGPGLEYKVSYRQQGVEEDWQEHMVKRHSLVVKNTPPYVPYDVKVQAANDLGWAPEPKVYTVYSGEDLPDMAPSDVAVTVLNSSRIHVSWTPVPVNHVWGLLGGYKVQLWRLRDLLNIEKGPKEKETMVISGNLSYTTVQGLIPFSEYSLMVGAFNGRGMGPSSHPVTFKTPEGVPEKISILKATNAQKDAITLVWSPPLKAHGVLTGYLLQYQMVNDTADFESLHNVTIRGPDSTQWVLKDLETVTRYRFYVSACTRVGCGPPVSEESQTTPTGLAVKSESSDPWFIGSMCAAVALTLVVLIACFVRRNIGGKYSVKEKEDARSDVQSQGATNNASSEYSDNEKKPLKASLCSLKLDSEENSCGVSMTDSEDEDDRFGEDGSFIGEYAGHKRPGSTEANGAALVTA